MNVERSREIRREAWALLWKERWFWRFVCASILLGLVGYAAQEALTSAYGKLQIAHWGEYLAQYLTARLGNDLLMVPSRETALRMSAATGALWLLGAVFAGCARCGEGVVLLKAVRGETAKWMDGMWRGFRTPFVHFAMQLLVVLAVAAFLALVGGLALVVAGRGLVGDLSALGFFAGLLLVLELVAQRYFEPLWLVRAEHVDWTLGQVFAETRRRMKGHRLELLGLLASYRVLPLVVFVLLAAIAIPDARLALSSFLLVAAIPFFMVVPWHLRAGVALFWRDLCAAETALAGKPAETAEM